MKKPRVSKSCVLDASALLALIFNEKGKDMVLANLDNAFMSSVNVSEVVAKLFEKGLSESLVVDFLNGFGFNLSEFDSGDAFETGKLRLQTKSLGLSLGDRACIALAIKLGVPVITSDRAFSGVNKLVEVQLLR